MWFNRKEYYPITKWVKIFSEDYKEKGIKVDSHKLRILFGHYKLHPIFVTKNQEITTDPKKGYPCFSVSSVNQIRTMKEDFMTVFTNILKYGTVNNKEDDDLDNLELTYPNDENDMEKYSNYLINQYQFENKIPNIFRQTLLEWGAKKINYNDNDKIELVKDKNVINGGNFPIKRQGKIYWVSRSMTISLYVFCKNKMGEWCLLASKRGPNVKGGANKWNAVCGYLDYGYTLEEAAVKECYEETGVKISTNILHKEGINSKRRQGDVSARFSAVLSGVTSDYPTSISNCEDGEVTEAKWIPLSEVDKYVWFGNQGMKARDVSNRIIGYSVLENNEDYKNIVLSLRNLLEKGVIDNKKYEMILKLLK